MKTSWIDALALVLFATVPTRQLEGTQSDHPQDGNNAFGAQAGKEVVIALHNGLGKKVRGAFAASNSEGLTVRAKDGKETAVPWDKFEK